MNTLDAIRKLIVKASRVQGEVTEVISDTLTVSLSSGTRLIKNNTATKIQVGDKVLIEGNQLVGKVARTSSLPIYYV